ncbi:hypothetical protein CLOM_g22930 [Closterium sp. NIES-68]|nr:hypothetical protein CLOM_g22930 [Closterium sp. NIES-68]GJP86824.1 hypothetical protein CLOP_g16800 [Closterium sp. NIES-67]
MKPLVYAILLLVLLGTLDAALARPKRARPKRASPAVFMDGRRWYPHPHAFRPKRASLAHPLLDQREPSPRRFRLKRHSLAHPLLDQREPSPRRFRLKRHSLAHPLLDQREPSPRRFRPKRARLVSRTSYDPEGDFAMSHHYRPKRASPAHASGPRMLRGGGAEMGPVTRYSTVDPNDYYPDWYTPPSYWTDLGYGSSWDYGSDMSPYGDYYLNLNDQLFGSDGDWTNGGSGDFSSVYGGYGDYGSY